MLKDPNSKAVRMLLFLRSFESLDAPIYSLMNKACRELDMTMLNQLGPFAQAMNVIMQQGNHIEFKRKDNKRQKGYDYEMMKM